MSMSNRSYLCVVCGALRRAPLPSGLLAWISVEERHRREVRLGVSWPEETEPPLPYGHWRGWVVAQGQAWPRWLNHCDKPMFILGKRAAQAATQIEALQRLAWIALGCRVLEHPGGKRWRPVLREAQLKDAYPLV